jgi:hypothetical protein
LVVLDMLFYPCRRLCVRAYAHSLRGPENSSLHWKQQILAVPDDHVHVV